MTYSSVFGSKEIYEVLNVLSRKAYATLLASFQRAGLFTEVTGTESNIWLTIQKNCY